MSWFNNLFKKKVDKVVTEQKVVDPFEGIGEPCISFVNTVRSNPKRFKATLVATESTESGYTSRSTYIFKDMLLGIEWGINERVCYYAEAEYAWYGLPSWMSRKEQHYVVNRVCEVYSQRNRKLKELLDKRGRQNYINKYCK